MWKIPFDFKLGKRYVMDLTNAFPITNTKKTVLVLILFRTVKLSVGQKKCIKLISSFRSQGNKFFKKFVIQKICSHQHQ